MDRHSLLPQARVVGQRHPAPRTKQAVRPTQSHSDWGCRGWVMHWAVLRATTRPLPMRAARGGVTGSGTHQSPRLVTGWLQLEGLEGVPEFLLQCLHVCSLGSWHHGPDDAPARTKPPTLHRQTRGGGTAGVHRHLHMHLHLHTRVASQVACQAHTSCLQDTQIFPREHNKTGWERGETQR